MIQVWICQLILFKILAFSSIDISLRHDIKQLKIPILKKTTQQIIEIEVNEELKTCNPFSSGAIIGILLFIAIYNLGFYFAIKDITFLWYVCFQFFTGITWFAIHGYMAALCFPNAGSLNHTINKLFMVGMALSFFLFTKTFLRYNHYFPKLNNSLSKIVFTSFLLAGVCSIVTPDTYPLELITDTIGIAYLPLVIILAVYSLKKGFTPSAYFLAAQFLAQSPYHSPVQIIDIFNSEDKPAGTRVIINIPLQLATHDKCFNYR